MTTARQRELQPRRLDDLPSADTFEVEFPCPADRFVALSREARTRGTLPQTHAEARRKAFAEALKLGHTAYRLARMAAIHSTRGYQLKAEVAS